MTARPTRYIGVSLVRCLVRGVSGATLYDKHRDEHWDVWAVGSQR